MYAYVAVWQKKKDHASSVAWRGVLTQTCCLPAWAAPYDTWLLIQLMPKGAVFSFHFFSVACLRLLGYMQACPCKPEDVCKSDNLGLFADGNCNPARFHWFWPHGGKATFPSLLFKLHCTS